MERLEEAGGVDELDVAVRKRTEKLGGAHGLSKNSTEEKVAHAARRAASLNFSGKRKGTYARR